MVDLIQTCEQKFESKPAFLALADSEKMQGARDNERKKLGAKIANAVSNFQSDLKEISVKITPFGRSFVPFFGSKLRPFSFK